MNSAFYTVQKSGVITEDVREWRRRPEEGKMWESFKVHFTRAYNELKESAETAKSAVFHATNSAEGVGAALTDLQRWLIEKQWPI